MLWIVQRGISSSITQEYGDTTISTNFGLWPSGWQDGSKVQSFQTNLQKNFHSLYFDECLDLPLFHCYGTLTLIAV